MRRTLAAAMFLVGCGRLVDYESVCSEDVECGDGWLCTEAHLCQKPCVTASDCPNEVPRCENGYCVTAEGPECSDGFFACAGVCVPEASCCGNLACSLRACTYGPCDCPS